MTVKYFRKYMGSDTHFEDRTTELFFRQTEPGDVILIDTLNSKYVFSVLDPITGKGMLSGGSLADSSVVAFLTGALDKGRDGLTVDADRIRTGARALFYFDVGNVTRSLILSKIVRVTLIRDPKGNRLIA